MLFAVITENKTDSVDLRSRARPEHLAWLDSLGKTVVLAGPILDASGQPCAGIMIFDVADQKEAEETAAKDPYMAAELFESVSIRPFSATYKDGVRDK